MTSPDTRAVIISYVPPAANTSNMWLKWEQNHNPHNSPAWAGCWILIGSRLHPVPTGKKIFVNSVQTVHKFKGTAICWQTLPPPTLPENPSLWLSALCNSILINLCSGSAFLCFFFPPGISREFRFPRTLRHRNTSLVCVTVPAQCWCVATAGSAALQVISIAVKAPEARFLEGPAAPRSCWLPWGVKGAHPLWKLRA